MLKIRKYIPGFLILFGLLITSLFFKNAGLFLIFEDEPREADAIVVLMGSPGDRMLQAYDFFEAGYADKVIMVDTYLTGKDVLAERGVILKTNTEIAKETGIALGINENAIIIIPGEVRSTWEEAIAVRNFINSNPEISAIILITSGYHTRRSRAIFRRAFSKLDYKVELIVVPSKYTEFKDNRWYSERQSAKRVFEEYTRLIYFWIWERWKI